jgi:hypothetical protein
MAKAPVEVAEPSRVFPRSVVEPRKLEATELNTPAMVEEADTLSAEVVAAVTERLRSVVSPALLTEKRLDVTPAEVVEEMAKSVVVAVVEAACTERSA